MSELPGGTVTLLFSDIEGSTGLLKRLGDGWPAALEQHRMLIRDAVHEHAGVVVDCQGDALFSAFRSAHEGIGAALVAQQALAAEPWPAGVDLPVRMALHTGEPTVSPDGYTGIDVVLAARLCAVGHGGQVLLTETVRLLSRVETIDLGSVRLKDIDTGERVHQLVAPGLRRSFPRLRAADASEPLRSMGELERDAEQRIERASADLEARITQGVARKVERALRRVGPRNPG